jgi:hypothetical protein
MIYAFYVRKIKKDYSLKAKALNWQNLGPIKVQYSSPLVYKSNMPTAQHLYFRH